MNATHPLPPEDVMAYVDGEMSAAAARGVQAHLAGCTACRQLEAELREGSRQMGQWHVEGSPASLAAPHPRRQPASRVWGFLTSRPLIAGAAAVVLIAAAIALRPAPKQMAAAGETVALSDPVDSLRRAERLGGVAFQQAAPSRVEEPVIQPGSRIVRTATLRVVATGFDRIRPEIERILKGLGGFAGELAATARPDSPRSIRGTLRIPSGQLDAA